MIVAHNDLKEARNQVAAYASQVVAEFDRGFEMAMAQAQVYFPDLNPMSFDPDNLVVDGQIVAPPPAQQPQPLSNEADVTNAESPWTLEKINKVLNEDSPQGETAANGTNMEVAY